MKAIRNYAARHYTNPNGNSVEFLKDMDRIKYIQRYISNRYKLGKIQSLQIINILVVLSNVFNLNSLVTILKTKVKKEFLAETWSYMLFLGMPFDPDLAHDKLLLKMIPYEYEQCRNL
jgi:hypothetical protein